MRPRVHYLLGGTVLTVLLQMSAGLLGPLGFLVGLLTPLPAAYVGMRQGWPVGVASVLSTTAVLLWIAGPFATASYFVQYGLASFLLPLFFNRGWPWDRAIAAALLLITAAFGISAAGLAALRGLRLPELVRQYVQTEMERAMSFWGEADLTADQVEDLRLVTQQMADFLVQTWPALFIAATGILLLLIVLVLSAAGGGKYQIPGPSFPQWKAPETLIWLLIAAGAGVLLASGNLQRIALNLLVVVLPVYFLQGLAIVSFWFRKQNFSPLFRNLGYVLIFIINPLPLVVTGLGVFDMWIDFRKPRLKKT